MAAPASSICVPPLPTSTTDAPTNRRGEELCVLPPHQRAQHAAAAPASLHSPAAAIELCMPASLHLPKHQNDVALQAYDANISFKCFNGFRRMFQVFYLNISKVHLNISYVAIVI
jgi:hypothetical protein